MNSELLENVLACPTLPSLPAVAAQVIELTGNDEVRMDDLAEVIQRDQGLAAKILRTVNSSFYGLRQPCATIEKALVMLGLGPVKTLALGFSLVSAVDTSKANGFDFQSYWRRGLFTAVGAKVIAEVAELNCADEAFLAGLLQDIGMVALFKALDRDYVSVLQDAGQDHNRLCRAELASLELQHPEIGAMLAERWKLPLQLTIPIRYHAKPTASPSEHAQTAKAVAAGNLAHDVLTADEAAPAMRVFYKRLREWFRITESQSDEILKRINAGTKELTALFSLDTGTYKNTDAVINDAQKRLLDLAKRERRESLSLNRFEGIIQSSDADALTGALNRIGFDAVVRASFRDAHLKGEPLALVTIAADGIAETARLHGSTAADDAVVSCVATLNNHFEPLGGVVCRLGTASFAVILPGTPRGDAARVAEEFRAHVEKVARNWLPDAKPGDTGPVINVSIGIACAEGESFDFYGTADRLTAASTKALQAARGEGGNLVRAFTPTLAA